jgi:hypothetical protein
VRARDRTGLAKLKYRLRERVPGDQHHIKHHPHKRERYRESPVPMQGPQPHAADAISGSHLRQGASVGDDSRPIEGLLMAQSRHVLCADECPLLGAKLTWSHRVILESSRRKGNGHDDCGIR